jgi:glycosyltransferase involved in cell wall biosynthesis
MDDQLEKRSAAHNDRSAADDSGQTPVFGFLLFGGPLSGGMVRDLRMAHELVERGYEVHLWWAMDRTKERPIDARIHQHWLMHGSRHHPFGELLGLKSTKPGFAAWHEVKDRVGRGVTAMTGDIRRAHFLQQRPGALERAMHGLLRMVAGGIERDSALIHRFARELDEAGVTHMLPMLAVLCPFVDAARQHTRRRVEYLVTFQGYELYLNYARAIGCEQALHTLFQKLVHRSGRRAIAVSEDYKQRVIEDIGLSADQLVAIPPGVDLPEAVDRGAARREVNAKLVKEGGRPELPLVSYLGRQDSEKGLDLLLYAAAILKRRGVDVQLAICGPTLFDSRYKAVCRQIATNLRLPVWFGRQLDERMRQRLFAASDCVVYPSIHREPFGMVAAEAAALGTPSVVPDYGGVASAIEAEGQTAGLRFRAWDSGSLAEQLNRLLTEPELWGQLHAAGPAVVEHYSVLNLADRVLSHLGLAQPAGQGAQSKAEAPRMNAESRE